MSYSRQLFTRLIRTNSNQLTCFSYNRIQTRSFMLDTTKVKILQCYQESVPHIQTLNAERLELTELTSDEAQMNKLNDKQDVFQRLSYLNRISSTFGMIEKVSSDLTELNEMGDDSEETDEFKKMIADDIERLNEKEVDLKIRMIQALIPEEEEDKENAIIELSAGVGGQESGIFCSELYNMYETYADIMGWSFAPIKVDTDQVALTEAMRKATFEINGIDVYKHFKFESGVHRVQRVPKTESKGRIHTSTVGVVVTPKPEIINIELNPKDLKIETKTSGGPGGQHANKTESAVRLTHLPTGIVVYCDAERHMMKNRQQAFDNLKQKLYSQAYEAQLNRRQQNRKMQIGSSSRSSRIRTYNFIQDRVTDHRLGENFIGISRFLSGENRLHKMIQNLLLEQQTEVLYEILEGSEINKKK